MNRRAVLAGLRAETYVGHLKELLKDYRPPKPTGDPSDKRKWGRRSRRKSRKDEEE